MSSPASGVATRDEIARTLAQHGIKPSAEELTALVAVAAGAEATMAVLRRVPLPPFED